MQREMTITISYYGNDTAITDVSIRVRIFRFHSVTFPPTSKSNHPIHSIDWLITFFLLWLIILSLSYLFAFFYCRRAAKIYALKQKQKLRHYAGMGFGTTKRKFSKHHSNGSIDHDHWFLSNTLPSSVVVELQLRIDPVIRSIREIINISRHRPVVRFLEVVASIHVTRIRWKVVWMSQATLSIHSMMYDVFSRLFLNGIFFNWFFLLDILVF